MMKRIALALITAVTLTACSSTGSAITNLNSTEFSAKTQEAGVVILDVRTAGEFMTGHIAGAINIDVEATTFDNQIAQLDKTKTYAVYCHSGRRSGIATVAMEKAGFTSMFNLTNGVADWIATGLPLVTT
ncbi:MAG: rhodanese-like domain-containing protein [Streptomycetaceae bacterium]|nr:MAG: rhodanese-like domain-containing protein [Streptomycetaceae bacterium]